MFGCGLTVIFANDCTDIVDVEVSEVARKRGNVRGLGGKSPIGITRYKDDRA